MQAFNDELRAKNKEFEEDLKEYKEITARELNEIKLTAIIDKYKFEMNSTCISNIEEKAYLL